MKDFRLINEAQKTKDAVAKARELAEQAAEQDSGAAGDVKARSTGLMEDVKGQITEQSGEMSEISAAKLNETLADFNAALPALREAGYILDAVTLELGVPPKIVATFSGGDVAPDEKIEALLEENAKRNLTVLLVKSVQQATKLQSKLNIKGMKPRGLSVEIGLVPKIAVRFVSA
jgi:hypothetical protein